MVTAYLIGGFPAAGKTTALEAADEQGFYTVEMGRIVKEIHSNWKRMNWIDEDEDVGEFASRLRKEEGKAVFARSTIADIKEHNDEEKDVVVSGIRSKEEMAEFIPFFDEIVPIGIRCSEDIRHERLMERDGKTKEECIERDEREEKWGTERFLDRHVSYIIRNENCTEDRLKAKVKMIYDSS